jgi:hypothetical protein
MSPSSTEFVLPIDSALLRRTQTPTAAPVTLRRALRPPPAPAPASTRQAQGRAVPWNFGASRAYETLETAIGA